MNILFLGPSCSTIEDHLLAHGHAIVRTEDKISVGFLEAHRFDFCISYRYKKIIKKPEIEWFGRGIINLHISMLPFNRGSDPNFWSYIEDTPRGVTIHLLDEGLDTGDILLQQPVDIDIWNDTLKTSYEKLSHAIETLFISNAERLLNMSIKSTKQKGAGSFHLSTDKSALIFLLHEQMWDTPVSQLIEAGKHLRDLPSEQGD